MSEWRQDRDKWGQESARKCLRLWDERRDRLVRERIARLLEEYGGDWNQVVNDHTLDILNYDDIERIDREILATGYRYECAADVSPLEEPERYQPDPKWSRLQAPSESRLEAAPQPAAQPVSCPACRTRNLIPPPRHSGGRMGFARIRCQGCARVLNVKWRRSLEVYNVWEMGGEIEWVRVYDPEGQEIQYEGQGN